MTTKNEIARNAFYGNNEALMTVINEKHGYEMDGEMFPANGLSLNEVIETVEAMSENEIAELEALGII
jgi:hypothetical protein